MRVPVGWAGHSVQIEPGWRVLDVGSGHAPNQRADTLLEMKVEDDSHRSGTAIDQSDPRLVIGDACNMPFGDKAFDYILATHLAEHVDDPGALCRELSRVGRAGYIETPGWFGDIIMRESFHRWRVRKLGAGLVFTEVTIEQPLGRLGEFIYAVIYAGRQREGHAALYSTNPVGRAFLTAVRYWIAALFRLPILIDLMYMRYEWRDSIPYQVKRRAQPYPTQPPSGAGVPEG
jgi:SAM-dependent methyltransferase